VFPESGVKRLEQAVLKQAAAGEKSRIVPESPYPELHPKLPTVRTTEKLQSQFFFKGADTFGWINWRFISIQYSIRCIAKKQETN
jgi:hypothetical protein